MKVSLFLSVLVAILVSNPNTASATKSKVPTSAQVAEAKAKCDTDYKSHAHRHQCKLGVDVSVIELRVAAGETKLVQELQRMRSQMARVEKMLRDAKVTAPAAKRGHKSPPQPPVRTSSVPAPRVVTVVPASAQPGYQVVEMPGRYAAATWCMPGMGTHIEVRGVSNGANSWVGRGMKVRVIVIKNGAPLAIAQPGLPGRPTFEQVYADLDGDGQPEQRPYFVVNPRMVDTLFVGWRAGEKEIKLVYLIESGQAVAAPGIPPQPLWRTHKRVSYPFSGPSPTYFINAGGGWRD